MGNSSLPTADAAKSYGFIFYIFVYLLQIEMKTCHKMIMEWVIKHLEKQLTICLPKYKPERTCTAADLSFE